VCFSRGKPEQSHHRTSSRSRSKPPVPRCGDKAAIGRNPKPSREAVPRRAKFPDTVSIHPFNQARNNQQDNIVKEFKPKNSSRYFYLTSFS
jgi:hypothetical protein